MDKEIFVKKIQVSGILFKYNVPINEAKIIGTFIEELEQQCKKQKEVIDKTTEYITKEKNNYLHHVQKAIGKCIDDKGNINSNTAGLLLSAAVNTCDCTLNILNKVSE